MKKKPSNYTPEDLDRYRDLIIQTGVMLQPNNTTSKSRVTQTKKWREILLKFHIPTKIEATGSGVVQFLPRDIKGMQKKLNLLLGEYQAGNR